MLGVSVYILFSKDEENEVISKLIALLEIRSDYEINITENSGGYNKDIAGQVSLNIFSQFL